MSASRYGSASPDMMNQLTRTIQTRTTLLQVVRVFL